MDDSGRIIGSGYGRNSRGLMGSTTVRLGGLNYLFPPGIQLRNLQRDPEWGDGWVRFVQSTGGRLRLPRRPGGCGVGLLQWQAPTVWTTLSLTLHAGGRAEFGMPGASRFPRHWVYDGDGRLSRKSGLADFRDWYRKSFGHYSPWGDADSRGACHGGRDSAGARAIGADDARRG